MKKNKFAMIKDFEKCNNNFDVKRIYRQIIDYNYYFKSKKFVKIKI